MTQCRFSAPAALRDLALREALCRAGWARTGGPRVLSLAEVVGVEVGE